MHEHRAKQYRTRDEARDHLRELLELIPASTRRRLPGAWGKIKGYKELCEANPDVAAFVKTLFASTRSRDGDGVMAKAFASAWPEDALALWSELASGMADARKRHEWSLIRRLLKRLARAGDTSRSGARRGAVLDELTDTVVPWAARARLWAAIEEAGRTGNVPPDLGEEPELDDLSLAQTIRIRQAIDRGRRRAERSAASWPTGAPASRASSEATSVTEAADTIESSDAIQNREEVALLVEAVRELSDEQQTILRLWLNGEGYRAIGARLGISPSKVGRDLASVMARLANRLSSWIL